MLAKIWSYCPDCHFFRRTDTARGPVPHSYFNVIGMQWKRKAVERHESRSVLIFFHSPDVLISAVSAQTRKYRSVTKQIDTFVHARFWVLVPNWSCVHFLIVDTKVRSSISLRYRRNLWGAFRHPGSSNIQGKHSIYLLHYDFHLFRTWKIWSWAYRPSIHILEFNLVRITSIDPRCPSHLLPKCVSMYDNYRDSRNIC